MLIICYISHSLCRQNIFAIKLLIITYKYKLYIQTFIQHVLQTEISRKIADASGKSSAKSMLHELSPLAVKWPNYIRIFSFGAFDGRNLRVHIGILNERAVRSWPESKHLMAIRKRAVKP